MSILTKILGDPNAKAVKALDVSVSKINDLEQELQALTDKQLAGKTEEFKQRLEKGETLDDIQIEAFAVVREAAKRTLGQRHYDVQVKGSMVMHRGQIAEMRTGEGKTLTSTMAVYLNALSGKGVHLVTVNDYLAKRDAVWMGQVYHFLGLSIGIIQHQQTTYQYDPEYQVHADEGSEVDQQRDKTGSFKVEDAFLRPISRKEAYECDITYGTNNEFGFDYLRDNMVQRLDDMVQRGHNYAVIDEIDSILIDEARTPLIISAPAAEATDQYYDYARIIKTLKKEDDFEVDEKARTAILTEAGIKKVEKALGMENIYTEGGIRTVHHVEQALRANALFAKDKNYVVEGGEVVIIDEFTGRKMQGRRYSEGLHQAIEAKEGVNIQRESRTMATVTFQNYFRMYDKLSGMTGTAVTEAEEFGSIYNLEVVTIPTNRPDARDDGPDRIYKTSDARDKAVVAQVKDLQERGQPVLIGTASIEKNEQLALLLEREGVAFDMLNAKNHEREGEVVAQAGKPGAVTLATNMAGRGVDIVLGGNPVVGDSQDRVKELGGLFVIGTERHESRRIDNQLRGRAGRQGDPGMTQFFISVEDDLMRIFAGDRIKGMMEKLNVPEDMPIEAGMISKAIETAQKKVEGHNFDIRKHLLEYDDVLNKHRESIYRKRIEVLKMYEGKIDKTSDGFESLKDMILDMFSGEIAHAVNTHYEDEKINFEKLQKAIAVMFPITAEVNEKLKEFCESKDESAPDQAIELLKDAAAFAYNELEKNVEDPDHLRQAERTLLIRTIDILWVDHLVAIDRLRAGIGLRGYAQRDPLVEYKKETYGMFGNLQAAIEHDVTHAFFKMGAATVMAPSLMEKEGLIMRGAQKTSNGNGVTQAKDLSIKKVGRNLPCPCGSGKKYKKCHGE